MYRITGQNIKNSNKLSDIEKIIIDHMLKWEDWNLKHNIIEEVFIVCIMGLKPSPLGETFR